MPTNTEIVKKLYDACLKKDYDTIKAVVDPNYHLKDPMMELDGVNNLIEMIKGCPDGKMENIVFVAEGDKVVGLFDGMPGDPKFPPMRMCSVITMKNGKVIAEEMFYDTAKIPADAIEDMKNKHGNKKVA